MRLPRPIVSLLLAFVAWGISAAKLPAAPAGAGVQVQKPWVRWLPSGLPGAGYLTLLNTSATDRFLVAASSPDYTEVQLHESYTAPDGTSRMRHVDKLLLPAHGQVRFAPGGYHLMLMKALHPIQPGDTVVIELKFDDGGALSVRMPVMPAGHSE